MIVIHLLNTASGQFSPYEDSYVVEFNPDPNVWKLVVTRNISEAKHFETLLEASEYWKQDVRGRIRYDGKPDRPLTAYNTTFDKV